MDDIDMLFDTGNFDAAAPRVKRPIKREHEDDQDEQPSTSRNIRCKTPEDTEEEDDDEVGSEPELKADDAFYAKFDFDTNREESLPIFDSRERILAAINDNPVVVLEGGTGCGKTTQVPQYILDDAYKRKQYCNIICTQPRRIAAISIANRVADERNWRTGSVVGYQVGLHVNMSEDTRLLYCTTGVLLKKLIKDKTLTHYTHIILDEVHERDIDNDFLMLVIRRFVKTNSKHVKVILMSATINSTDFSKYFTIKKQAAPILRVDSRRLYEVREYYLDDLSRLSEGKPILQASKPGISNEMYILVPKLILIIHNLEKQEHGALKSILVFLPGLYEIDELFDRISQLKDEGNFLLIRLHSLISPEEQACVFKQPLRGCQKIIFATNVAESSITVPDVKYVIDFCLTKVLVSNTSSHFSSLQLQWASRANCRQRAGRAGRLMNGRVYRLIYKTAYTDLLDEFGTPEMLRCPLETAVLNAKLLDMGTPLHIVSRAMSPPNLDDVRNTLLLLKEVGALYPTVNGEYSTEDGDLSYFGRIMAMLPLNVHLSRFVLLGYAFGCFEQAVVIAAGLTVRSIFTLSESKDLEIDSFIQKLTWARGSGSDMIAIWNAYNTYQAIANQPKPVQYGWAKKFFINLQSMKEMELLVRDVKQRLANINIKDFRGKQSIKWIDHEKDIVLKFVIAGAFYPNFFQIGRRNEDVAKERDLYHTLCHRDPCNSVYYTKYTPRCMGDLYAKRVKEFLEPARIDKQNMSVNFQPESEKIFVTFNNNNNGLKENQDFIPPGIVAPDVYKALRFRSLCDGGFHLKVMEKVQAMNYVSTNRIGQITDSVWQPITSNRMRYEFSALPSLYARYLTGIITHINENGTFYFQPYSEKSMMEQIMSILNDPFAISQNHFQSYTELTKGMIVAALFDNAFQRAEIITDVIYHHECEAYRVKFIDIGNIAIVDFMQLRKIPEPSKYLCTLPPRIFLCNLALVRPSVIQTPNGYWHSIALKMISNLSQNSEVNIEVYSVVHNVANVLVYIDAQNTLNHELLQMGLASEADESYLSKFDRDQRLRAQLYGRKLSEQERTDRKIEYLHNNTQPEDFNLQPPPETLCGTTVILQGPFSPLETKMYSLMRVGRWKSTSVERDSVNAVLLQDDTRDFYDRMLVSMCITETGRREALMARGTTMMPNLPGIAALVLLIFAPQLQLKRDSTFSRYNTLLAGLGYNTKSLATYYEEHDVVIDLDVRIDNEDIKLVNQIRYSIDSMFYTKTNFDDPAINFDDRPSLVESIKNLLMKFIKRKRDVIAPRPSKNVWERFPIKAEKNVNVFGSRSMLPVHNVLPITKTPAEVKHYLKMNCKELKSLAEGDATIPVVDCKLCNQKLENIVLLRIHLLSQSHCVREKQLNMAE